ncbi:MAG: hypothetical protein DRI77_13120 [Chloroflexi bacterium]|nr:MAG: hypothetical protein DRI77_13120 [Chloroflexota bacterium]
MDKMIAYCGLVCTECPAYVATQNDDQEALKRVAAQWSQQWNADITPEYCICDGCLAFEGRLGGHCIECPVRACGVEKKVQNCAYCGDYPCQELEKFFVFAPEAKVALDKIRQSLQVV